MPYDPMNQVHPGPLEGIDRIPADTIQARTGNTEREQEAWFVGVEEGQRRTEHNAAVRSAWMPIESAPKDGTEIWAYNGEQARMHWIEGEGYALWAWADELLSNEDPNPGQPTHWQPLPAAPGSPESAAPGDAPEPIKLVHLAVAWEIRSPAMPASVELTPFVARAQEAWQQGFEVHDLVRRVSAPVAAQAAPPVASAEPVAWPRVFGVSRDLHPRCLMISLAQEPTDDQMRAIHDALRRAPVAAQQSNKTGTNSGHGHVWDRPDGLKAKCGGPGFCSQCSRDQAARQGKGGAA
ncbi:hypothetical protein ACXXNA_05865 [Bordetella bronchiseptica]